jgi:hypothetical protein
MRVPSAAASAVLLTTFSISCGFTSSSSHADLHSQDVALPGGQTIHVETMISRVDLMRGMMFRTSLAPDHGMLFVQKEPGLYSAWTYQVEIPLDMIWMDKSHQIVEIVENVPPCRTKASQCPSYGGTKVAQYELELAGGMARKYGLQIGQRLEF